MRHLITLEDLSKDDFFKILKRGEEHRKNRKLAPESLKDKNIAILFEKSSTRTRLSFHMAITEMGGNVVPLESSALQIGRGETVEDTIEVFARYLDGVMIRARSHEMLEKMAARNRIPVINGLTDLYHPCQAMADYMTLQSYGYDPSKKPVKLVFIGEGNNVFNSLALGAMFTGAELRIASPQGYEVSDDIRKKMEDAGVKLTRFNDPYKAVEGANVIYTDVWVSMGQEEEESARKSIFSPYTVSLDLLENADPEHIVLHCLPAHRGEEIQSDVMEKYSDIIFNQAENRLHVQKAILEWIYHVI